MASIRSIMICNTIKKIKAETEVEIKGEAEIEIEVEIEAKLIDNFM